MALRGHATMLGSPEAAPLATGAYAQPKLLYAFADVGDAEHTALSTRAERAILRRLTRQQVGGDALQLQVLAATTHGLHAALADRSVAVLHISAHGDRNELHFDGAGRHARQDSGVGGDAASVVTASTLCALIAHPVKLLVLSVCNSAGIAAAVCAARKAEFAIGCSADLLHDDVAADFIHAFYSHLLRGVPLNGAFERARSEVERTYQEALPLVLLPEDAAASADVRLVAASAAFLTAPAQRCRLPSLPKPALDELYKGARDRVAAALGDMRQPGCHVLLLGHEPRCGTSVTALRAAHLAFERGCFPGGAYSVDLRAELPPGHPGGVAFRVGAALGLDAPDPPAELVLRMLISAQQDILLVLDNAPWCSCLDALCDGGAAGGRPSAGGAAGATSRDGGFYSGACALGDACAVSFVNHLSRMSDEADVVHTLITSNRPLRPEVAADPFKASPPLQVPPQAGGVFTVVPLPPMEPFQACRALHTLTLARDPNANLPMEEWRWAALAHAARFDPAAMTHPDDRREFEQLLRTPGRPKVMPPVRQFDAAVFDQVLHNLTVVLLARGNLSVICTLADTVARTPLYLVRPADVAKLRARLSEPARAAPRLPAATTTMGGGGGGVSVAATAMAAVPTAGGGAVIGTAASSAAGPAGPSWLASPPAGAAGSGWGQGGGMHLHHASTLGPHAGAGMLDSAMTTGSGGGNGYPAPGAGGDACGRAEYIAPLPAAASAIGGATTGGGWGGGSDMGGARVDDGPLVAAFAAASMGGPAGGARTAGPAVGGQGAHTASPGMHGGFFANAGALPPASVPREPPALVAGLRRVNVHSLADLFTLGAQLLPAGAPPPSPGMPWFVDVHLGQPQRLGEAPAFARAAEMALAPYLQLPLEVGVGAFVVRASSDSTPAAPKLTISAVSSEGTGGQRFLHSRVEIARWADAAAGGTLVTHYRMLVGDEVVAARSLEELLWHGRLRFFRVLLVPYLRAELHLLRE